MILIHKDEQHDKIRIILADPPRQSFAFFHALLLPFAKHFKQLYWNFAPVRSLEETGRA